ncbi:MAG: all3515 family Zur-repressed PEP-CTERM protein [Nostoc sp. LLA-1]|nr:all3515 family Zur-repressed PEP-CTERM protein [Cyanocohniella sp. LLY]
MAVSNNISCSKKPGTPIRKATASLAVSFLVATPLVVSTAFSPAQAHDDHTHETEYFIGVDALQVLNRGIYSGLDNPNYNRLTFLYNHGDHFHGIGAYSYFGDIENSTIESTSTNNRIPESYTEIPPLKLLPGTGIYSGRLVSTDIHEPYSDLKIEPLASLQDYPDPEAQVLFNSSDGRWNASLTGATIGLKLAEISPGLNIGDAINPNIVKNVGDIHTIGRGDNFAFTPTFWTDATAPVGNYSATFQLVDLSSNFQESGTFSFDFQVAKVPEPSTTIGFSLVALLGLSVSRLKKRSSSSFN